MNISELAVKRPSLFVVIFSILALVGIFSYTTLSYELLPNINNPVLTVTTMYTGASPSEVENSVTKKVEQQVSSIQDVEKINASSLEGISVVTVTLKTGADVDEAVQTAQRKVNSIVADFPEGVDQPTVDKISLDEQAVLTLGVTSDLEPTKFSDLLTDKISPELSRLEGIARIDVTGDTKREIKVNVNADKMETYNLSIVQITNAIAAANLDFPTGKIKDNASQLQVRLSGKLKTVNDLRNLIITTTNAGNPVYLTDVAEVEDGTADVTFITHLNGNSSVGISIIKQSDGNAVEVSKLVHDKIEKLTKEYSDINLHFIVSSDQSIFTLEAADGVIHDLILAIILVAVIMYFFLHSPKNAFIVMVSIPLSLISTFIVMYALDYSLNLMSLLGLSLVVGILVDDSIVVLENIFTHLEKGKTPREASMTVGKEIGMSVASITLVIVVVFLPILFVNGLVADILRQFCVVIIVATLLSLFVSFTITPILAARFTKIVHLDKTKWFNQPIVVFEKMENKMHTGYRKLLNWSLNHKRKLMFTVLVLIVGSLSLMKMGMIGSEFVNSGDNGEFTIEAKLPKDATIEQTNLAAIKIEGILRKHKEISNVFTTVGASAGAVGNQSQANALLANVKMIPLEERSISSTNFSVQLKRELFTAFPGIEIKTKAVSLTGSIKAPVQIIVESTNMDSLFAYGKRVRSILESVPGTAEIETSVEDGNPELSVSIDRQRMADLNLTMDIVGGTLRNSLAGNTDYTFSENGTDYDINVRLDVFNRKDPKDLLNIIFLNKKNEVIRLSQFATVSQSFGPTKLERYDKVSSLTVSAFVVGRASGTVGNEVKAKIEQLSPSRGINIRISGDLENQEDSFVSLGMALLVSLILVYLIMVALYDNYIQPFVVMFSIPVAVIGAFLALALFLQNMSIFAMLGLIMLIGLVVKNAILIVDYINHLRAQGKPLIEAITEGTMERFRPILMTTLAMVFAMFPVALASGAGAEWKNGLAWVLIGGLTSSMLLTMLVVPAMYLVMEIIREKLSRKKVKPLVIEETIHGEKVHVLAEESI